MDYVRDLRIFLDVCLTSIVLTRVGPVFAEHPARRLFDRGIPISLSILWMEVGRRAGLEMQGVGLPGHFVVYAAGQLVYPFHYGEAI